MEIQRFSEWIGQSAVRAILYEVSATPKPGLVDRRNSGAHQDMDFYTFLDSTAALHGVFDRFTEIGIKTRELPYREAREALQTYGLEAEQKMFTLTRGINTHKGIIFSLGFLCGAIGRLGDKQKLTPQSLSKEVKMLCAGLCQEVYSQLSKKAVLTKGEAVYLRYGVKGARAEAENGFPTVVDTALPQLIDMVETGMEFNAVCVYTLLVLIAEADDTNVLSRNDLKTAEDVKQKVRKLIGKIKTEQQIDYSQIEQLDQDFIKGNISPGGCADLLAVTLFIYFICCERR